MTEIRAKQDPQSRFKPLLVHAHPRPSPPISYYKHMEDCPRWCPPGDLCVGYPLTSRYLDHSCSWLYAYIQGPFCTIPNLGALVSMHLLWIVQCGSRLGPSR